MSVEVLGRSDALTFSPSSPISRIRRITGTRPNVKRSILILVIDLDVSFSERFTEIEIGAFDELLFDFGCVLCVGLFRMC